ncbi:hypothetical protein EIP91_008946 [Steccherinum ochraceum]|uniref:Protein kinase domain-containing protein n=1 Tax=Steccherinum ochraceum TaxID=92696 RepID=A0A4R0RXY9_9APHY|nr:hypothetical protein EIP91_008946 [Steccherinum ochraceum]
MADAAVQPIAGPSKSNWLPAKSWQHFVAGGVGGMCGAIVTSPFDVVKTRLQSSLFREKHTTLSIAGNGTLTVPHRTGLLYNFVETGHILRDIYREESPRALFKGLGPTLVGVIPARSINFFAYGNGKHVIANKFNHGEENTWVHLTAAACAGVVTGTATNPIWVVKTRLQLEADGKHSSRSSLSPDSSTTARARIAKSTNSWDMIQKIMREEGVRGFYKGLSASYLGVTEGTIQWTLYERLKKLTANTEGKGGAMEWVGMIGSAGTAKCVASLITYPHEVIRTRLRQPLVDGKMKYTGLVQTLRLVIAEEGTKSLYGGLSAHLMRVIPNAAVMFFIYEAVLRWRFDWPSDAAANGSWTLSIILSVTLNLKVSCIVSNTSTMDSNTFFLNFHRLPDRSRSHQAEDLANYPHCSFDADGQELLIPHSLDVLDVLYCSSRTTVYSAVAVCYPDGHGTVNELVLKLTSEQKALVEAGNYDAHVALQGKVIPRLYGVLFGEREEGEDLGCLVLERFGSCLKQPFHELPSIDKAKILDKLAEAHHNGLHHLDFEEPNILVQDGEYRITDLGHVTVHEWTCGWSYKFADHIGEDEYRRPEQDGWGCEIIRREAAGIGFWNDYRIQLLPRFYVPKSDDLPSQEETNRMNTDIGIGVGTKYLREDRQDLAIRYYNHVKTLLQTGHSLEELVPLRSHIAYKIHVQWHAEKNLPFSTLLPWER